MKPTVGIDILMLEIVCTISQPKIYKKEEERESIAKYSLDCSCMAHDAHP